MRRILWGAVIVITIAVNVAVLISLRQMQAIMHEQLNMQAFTLGENYDTYLYLFKGEGQ